MTDDELLEMLTDERIEDDRIEDARDAELIAVAREALSALDLEPNSLSPAATHRAARKIRQAVELEN